MLSCNVSILTKLSHCSPTSLYSLHYAFYLHPIILYGIVLWGFAYSFHLHKMQMIQKSLRAICSLNCREHVTSCYSCLNILKIYDVAKLEIAKFANQSLSKYFLTYFNRISASHNYCTRSSSKDKFVIPLFKTTTGGLGADPPAATDF